MITANAKTDEAGNSISDWLRHGLKALPLIENKKDPWSMKIDTTKKEPLAKLLSINKCKYHLLANYLFSELKIPLSKDCNYGCKGTIRSIVIDNYEYRSDAYLIYKRKKLREKQHV